MAIIFTNAGKTILANRIKGLGTEPKYFAWGTSATVAAATDTILGAEASEARVNGTSSIVTVTTTNDTYQVVATITANGTKTIQEVGLFDAATVGNLYFHANITALPVNNGDVYTFTIKDTFS